MNIEEYEKIAREHVARFGHGTEVTLVKEAGDSLQHLLTLSVQGHSVSAVVPFTHLHSHTPQLIRVQTENLRISLIQAILDDTLGKGVLNVR